MSTNIQHAAAKFLSLMTRVRHLGPGTPPPEEAQITPSLLTMLENVASNPGLGTQAMAENLGLATPTVSIGVRQLVEVGLLSQQPDPQDGRAVQIFLTPKGKDLYQRTQEFRCQRFERLLSELTPGERNNLLDLLERAINAAESE